MNLILKVADHKEKEDIFNLLRDGLKTIDTRPYSTKFNGLKVGDEIIFKHIKSGGEIVKSVKRIAIFKTIDEMAKKENIEKIIPSAKTKEDLLKVYRGFRGFIEGVEKSGIIAIELEQSC
ncbi:MAG: hypothetical protein M1355_01565 [Patescibacteria group bacterium]|nr:hypothetical protein [Patescibacteria group bacterium]